MIRLKYILCLFFTCAVSLTSFSQESDGSYLFRDSKAKLTSFYVEVSPATSFSWLNDQLVNITEASTGFILNNRFYFSYFMTGSPKINTVAIPEPFSDEWFKWIEAGVELDRVSSDAEFLYVKFRHAGLRFGYMHNIQKTVFWRAGLFFGFTGGLRMTEDQTFLRMFDNLVWETAIITLGPHMGVGVNLLPWWRVNLDLGYRLMSVDKRVLKSTETDSFTLKFGFAFGNFRQK
jgi:hypothetical protein